MSFKPDYGLKLLSSGTSRSTNLHFCDFRLYSLTILGRGDYSTMVEIPVDGQVYAMSLDFNQSILDQILCKAPHEISSYLNGELLRDPNTLRTIDFNGEVVFGVRAQLGELQRAQEEQFVPLVAQEII